MRERKGGLGDGRGRGRTRGGNNRKRGSWMGVRGKEETFMWKGSVRLLENLGVNRH